MFPFAYGGPSCSTNFGRPTRRARIFPYRSIAAHRASVSGSDVGRLAFIGKSVRGKLTVSFHSGMRIQRFYNEWMSRRDDGGARALPSGRSAPAGGSPASVSAGAPSSGPRARGESRVAQAGCQKPLWREQARGPQPNVKPAASTDLQPESRTAHTTVKAMSDAPQTGARRASGLGGVRGAARVHGAERNTRGPSGQPWSGQRASYKSTTNASAVQRASEGTIVVTSRATNNARGAKGPCGGNVGRASTRKGMTGKTGSNQPGRRGSVDHVRQLQRRLWSAAKRQPGRRFH